MTGGDKVPESRDIGGDDVAAPLSPESPGSSVDQKVSPKTRRLKPVSEEQKRETLDQLFFEGEGGRPSRWHFFTLLILSVIIAGSGLLLDSTAVVIAAMLVAPLMTPILATAAALVNLWARRFIQQVLLVAVGTIVAIALSMILPFVFGIPQEWLLPEEVVARTRPGAPDLLVALAAGFAGAYVLAQRETVSAVVGVAIAVALVPPLSACGILIYLAEYQLAINAFYLFVTNYAAIIFTACAVFVAYGLTPDFSDRLQNIKLGSGVLAAATLVLAIGIPLITETIGDVTAARDRIRATRALEAWLGDRSIDVEQIALEDDSLLVSLVLDVPFERRGESLETLLPGDGNLGQLQALLAEHLGREVAVELQGQIRYLATAEARSETASAQQ